MPEYPWKDRGKKRGCGHSPGQADRLPELIPIVDFLLVSTLSHWLSHPRRLVALWVPDRHHPEDVTSRVSAYSSPGRRLKRRLSDPIPEQAYILGQTQRQTELSHKQPGQTMWPGESDWVWGIFLHTEHGSYFANGTIKPLGLWQSALVLAT